MEPKVSTHQAVKRLDIECLFLDVGQCGRCRKTVQNLQVAIEMLRSPLASRGIELVLREVLVESEEQAIRERLVISPTIRIQGHDIAEIEQSPCDDCSDLCGCSGGTRCRVWNYRGEQHDAAPLGLLLEAITNAASSEDDAVVPPDIAPDFQLSANLVRFFAGKAGQKESADREGSSCCDSQACAGAACDCDCGDGDPCDCNPLESDTCGCHT